MNTHIVYDNNYTYTLMLGGHFGDRSFGAVPGLITFHCCLCGVSYTILFIVCRRCAGNIQFSVIDTEREYTRPDG